KKGKETTAIAKRTIPELALAASYRRSRRPLFPLPPLGLSFPFHPSPSPPALVLVARWFGREELLLGEMAKKSRKRRKNPMASLTDDLVVEILSRLPIKSLSRCKGVSRHWRSLVSSKDHRRKLSQTHPGLFYRTINSGRFPKEARHFTHVWEGRRDPLVCPSLSFLPGYERISIVDCCNGILLCRFSESTSLDTFRYIVCNPAENRFVVLPDSGCGSDLRVARLAFDPSFYPYFHVFEFVDDDSKGVTGAQIYSYEAETWSYKESGWSTDTYIFHDSRCVFYNGFLLFVTGLCEALVVDVEGDTWWMMPLPDDADCDMGLEPGFIGQYKEHLCYINKVEDKNDLSIWILEDKDEWVLKHQVSIQQLCEKSMSRFKSMDYHVIGILPDCNFILYIAGRDRTLMAYDIDREEVHAIQNLWPDCWRHCFLYVPLYTE
ncbi:hypothetical protein EJB05_05864, partial [Eragrostis curvula]